MKNISILKILNKTNPCNPLHKQSRKPIFKILETPYFQGFSGIFRRITKIISEIFLIFP